MIDLESISRHLRAALDDVQRDPRESERIADDALTADTLPHADRALALWLLGRAQHELDRVDDACQTLDAARSLSVELGDHRLAAEIAVSEAVCWMTVGDAERSTQLLDGAERHLSGGPLGRLVMQRGLLDLYRGALHVALESFDAASALLDAVDDDIGRCRLLANRGVVHTQLGNVTAGLDDFSTCRALAVRLDQSMIAAGSAHNMGFLCGRRGEFPEALQWFETARSEYEAVGFPHRAVAVLESDRCAMLLGAGLVDEAIVSANRALAAAASSGNQIAEADARLQLAQAELAAGRDDAAAQSAHAASRSFRSLDREPMATLSDYVELRAAARRAGEVDIDARPLLARLVEYGWVNEAQDVRLFIGEDALRAGRLKDVDDVLEEAAEARHSAPWALRSGGWYATALRRVGVGDLTGANRALGVGVKIVEQYRATMGATDLRAHAPARSSGLVDLGLRLALDAGDADRIFTWAERAQARTAALPSARPAGSDAMQQLLIDLRSEAATIDQAAAAGEHDADALERVGILEARIRNEDRTAQRAARGGQRKIDLDLDSLDDVADLIEFVDIAGVTHALVFDHRAPEGSKPAIVAIGQTDTISDLLDHALAALRRLAIGSSSERSLDASRAGLASIADELDALLFGRVTLDAEAPIVIVPSVGLRALPWSMLATCAGRPVAVAPSAAVWRRRATRRSADGRRVVLVAGPGLEHADAEITSLAECHAAAGAEVVQLDSAAGTVERVLAEFARADVVHIAAHGTFRSDSPMFSSVELCDGPLTVYDLERVTTQPEVVVLSACDAGRVAVRGGGELLGTAAALLQIGVSAVVAPMVALSDRAALTLMTDLHRQLADGVDVARAVGLAQDASRHRGGHIDVAAGASFTVLAGDRTTPR